jgi:hypothetical protein
MNIKQLAAGLAIAAAICGPASNPLGLAIIGVGTGVAHPAPRPGGPGPRGGGGGPATANRSSGVPSWTVERS